MTSGGYVKAYRRCWNHAAFRDKLDAAIWNYLYQNAAWEDTVVNHHGERIQLTRGQILISCRELADDFCTSEKRMRSLLQALTDGRTGGAMIGTQRTHRGTIITICNYGKYQGTKNAEGAQEAHSGRTEGHFPNKDNKTNETKEPNLLVVAKAKPQKATRLLEDWELPTEWGRWAEGLGMKRDDIITQSYIFKDYWTAKAGRDAAKLDWQATWRNWIRKHLEARK